MMTTATAQPDPLPVLELFCGIGGIAAVVGEAARVVGAVDLDRVGMGVYRANFGHPVRVRNLEAVSGEELAGFGAELWTMSPPCQPYTRRGKRRDLDDPRAASLLNLVRRLPEVRPAYLFLENVPGFEGSRAHQALRETLDGNGYSTAETLLCSSDLGWPNRRRRFYLVAARGDAEPLRPLAEPAGRRRTLAEVLDTVAENAVAEGGVAEDTVAGDTVAENTVTEGRPGGETAGPGAGEDGPAGGAAVPPSRRRRGHDGDLDLAVEPDLPLRYEGALHVVRRDDPEAVTTCFTSAYGRSHVRSGSYLVMDDHHQTMDGGLPRLRRFHPREILALLGFPPTYRLPPDLPVPNGWRLAGNSLSLPAVRHVLATIPRLGVGRDREWERRPRG